MSIARDFSLDAKYRLEEGVVFLSGIQALVRLPLDQHRADRAARPQHGARSSRATAGSPLGGLDLTLERNQPLLAEHNVVFISGLNEDLGATGGVRQPARQLLPAAEVRRRARHVVRQGARAWTAPATSSSTPTSPASARTAACWPWAATIPLSKSSTLPSHSEVAFYDALFPMLFPGNVQEILDMGLHGLHALAHTPASGSAFKIVTNVADEIGTAEVGPGPREPVDPALSSWTAGPGGTRSNPTLLPPYRPRHGARRSTTARLEAAKRLRRRERAQPHHASPTPDAWLGIVAAGKTYYDVRQALARARPRRRGAAPLRHPHPQDRHAVPDGAAHRPRVRAGPRGDPGRRGEALVPRDVRCATCSTTTPTARASWASATRRSARCVPANGELDADRIAQLRGQPPRAQAADRAPSRRAVALPGRAAASARRALTLARPAFFCSGCPHNRSTVVPEGSWPPPASAATAWRMGMDRGIDRASPTWAARARSGSASRRSRRRRTCSRTSATARSSTRARSPSDYAVAAGVNITYKILYNSAVAMTGGQDAAGAIARARADPAASRPRASSGSSSRPTIPTSTRASRSLGNGVEVWHRDRLDRGPARAARHPGRHRADPRPAVRGGEAAAAQARQAGRARPARLHQRARCARAAATAA